jgi:hypothetical protein
MSGFKQQVMPKTKDRIRSVETELQNSQMALRMSQAMTQQLMQNAQRISEDVGKLFGIINELQYKVLAMQDVLKLDGTQLNEIVTARRLSDFTEASDKEDREQGFTVGGTVTELSTVILTSKTANLDQGIFRSRVKMAEIGIPELTNQLLGKEVGATVTASLNGVQHEITLLGVRYPAPAAPKAEVVETTSTAINEVTQ